MFFCSQHGINRSYAVLHLRVVLSSVLSPVGISSGAISKGSPVVSSSGISYSPAYCLANVTWSSQVGIGSSSRSGSGLFRSLLKDCPNPFQKQSPAMRTTTKLSSTVLSLVKIKTSQSKTEPTAQAITPTLSASATSVVSVGAVVLKTPRPKFRKAFLRNYSSNRNSQLFLKLHLDFSYSTLETSNHASVALIEQYDILTSCTLL